MAALALLLVARYAWVVIELSYRSELRASVEEVWEHASTLAGVNAELWPIHMSGGHKLVLDGSTPLGSPLFRSVLSLARLLPLDLHTFGLEAVWPGRGFQEHSYSLLQRVWRHRRTVEPLEAGAVVTDHLQFSPRLLSGLSRRLVSWVFTRRHRVLRARFGESPKTGQLQLPAS